MKSTSKLIVTVALAFFTFFQPIHGQSVNLGVAANFTLFTITGAMDNTGISTITGNIGTNTGPITGFGVINGGIYTNNAVTRQCSTDVIAAYAQLIGSTPTSTTHTPAFGGGETLIAGVYSIAAAGSIAGIVNLDAQGDPNAVFIFKFGGAFTTGALSTINLINGASACNIFWGANGAIAMAAGTIMKGSLIANNGAISMGAGGTLEGRMLSTTGAVSVYGDYAYNSCGFTILPIELSSFTGSCANNNILLQWSTISESDNNYFTVEHQVRGPNWEPLGIVNGAGNSTTFHSYSFTDRQSRKGTSNYRIKQTNYDGNNKFGPVVAVARCADEVMLSFTLFPNPSTGVFKLLVTGNSEQVGAIEIFNMQGQKIYQANSFQQQFDLSSYESGIYIMHIHQYAKTNYLKIIVGKKN